MPALDAEVDDVAAVAKVDLHLHQERSARIEQVLAARHAAPSTDWSAWVDDLHSNVSPGIARLRALWANRPAPFDADRDPEVLIARLGQVMLEAAAAGAVLAEVRVGNETVLRPDFLECFREAEDGVRSRHSTFVAEPVVTVKLWHDRDQVEHVLETCQAHAGTEIHGIDLINMPYDAEADWTAARWVCARASEAGLGITAHAGEMSVANIDAVLELLGVTRIGHAVHVAGRPGLIERLRAARVVVECCLTSNVVLGAVRSYADHPITQFLERGIPVVLGTDDPLELSTSIEREYSLAHRAGLSIDDLRTITRLAVDVAFTSPARRTWLRNVLLGSVEQTTSV